MKKELFYFEDLEVYHIKAASSLNVNSINAHKSIYDHLSSIGDYWITERVRYDFNNHTRLNTNTIRVFHSFSCDSKTWHTPNNPFNIANSKKTIITLLHTKKDGASLMPIL